MSLYKEILPFLDYIHSIRKLENYLSYDMVFPMKWSLPKSLIEENQIVGFELENQSLKGISFVSEINEKDMSATLLKIAKVIKLNKEKEMKEKLFRDTIEKLKLTFEKTDLEKLKNLYFDFESNETDDEAELNINEDDTGERKNVEVA